MDYQYCSTELVIRNTAHPARHSDEGGNPDVAGSFWTRAAAGLTESNLVTLFSGPVFSEQAEHCLPLPTLVDTLRRAVH